MDLMNCGNWKRPREVESGELAGARRIGWPYYGRGTQDGSHRARGQGTRENVGRAYEYHPFIGGKGRVRRGGPGNNVTFQCTGETGEHNEVYKSTYIPTSYPPVHNKVYCCQKGEAQTE